MTTVSTIYDVENKSALIFSSPPVVNGNGQMSRSCSYAMLADKYDIKQKCSVY